MIRARKKKKNDSAGVTEFQLRQPKFPVPQRDIKWNRIKRYKVEELESVRIVQANT